MKRSLVSVLLKEALFMAAPANSEVFKRSTNRRLYTWVAIGAALTVGNTWRVCVLGIVLSLVEIGRAHV